MKPECFEIKCCNCIHYDIAMKSGVRGVEKCIKTLKDMLRYDTDRNKDEKDPHTKRDTNLRILATKDCISLLCTLSPEKPKQ